MNGGRFPYMVDLLRPASEGGNGGSSCWASAELRAIGQGTAAETSLRDWEDFVTFYHYPIKHGVHCQPANPFGSIFSGVRLRPLVRS